MTDDTDLNGIRQRHNDMLAGYMGTLRYTKYAEKDMGVLLAKIDSLRKQVKAAEELADATEKLPCWNGDSPECKAMMAARTAFRKAQGDAK